MATMMTNKRSIFFKKIEQMIGQINKKKTL